MKWYSSNIEPEDGRWIILCWGETKDSFSLKFDIVRYDAWNEFELHRCWAYLDIEEFLNGKVVQRSDLPQYTGKRLISI